MKVYQLRYHYNCIKKFEIVELESNTDFVTEINGKGYMCTPKGNYEYVNATEENKIKAFNKQINIWEKELKKESKQINKLIAELDVLKSNILHSVQEDK